jgi:hypothetical protein
MPSPLQNAKRAVVQVGSGRGFVVSAGESRYIITAAHCVPSDRLPTPHLANSTSELTFAKLIGRVGSKRQTIWAELCVYSLVDDVAVFAAPDDQAVYEECNRFEVFTAAAFKLGDPPVALAPHLLESDPGMAAFVLSLDCEWKSCTVRTAGRFLRIADTEITTIESGMSGSPIIDAKGAAIGLVSTSGANGSVNPSLMDCLPPWLLRKLT